MKSFSVLKWKVSRLRDWNDRGKGFYKPRYHRTLKWKVSRLRDWNILSWCGLSPISIHLKWKVSRLRDWNFRQRLHEHPIRKPWNEKHLDYEIETMLATASSSGLSLTWNEKYLDYEIETILVHMNACSTITTLKWKVSRLRDWNRDYLKAVAMDVWWLAWFFRWNLLLF